MAPRASSAAEAFRDNNSGDSVTILTDDPAMPYERPPLSKEFLRGDAEADDTLLHPAGWFGERSIDVVRTGGVDAIDIAERRVMADGTRYPYKWLVLACGSRPSPLPVPGGDKALQTAITGRCGEVA